MSSSRRLSNGRSPLVRKQSQITSFFSGPKENPSPSTAPLSNSRPKPSPDANLNPSPSPSTDPSPSQRKQKKPSLEVPTSPASNPRTPSSSTREKPHSAEVVGKKIRVFWPLDEAWYDGRVKSFDKNSGKHVIQYDDGEEEAIQLKKEKVEWVEEEEPRKLRRLRRMSDPAETEGQKGDVDDEGDEDDADDSTDDEEWGKNVGKEEALEDDSEEVELDDDDDEEVTRSRTGQSRSSSSARKRKKLEVGKLDCAKKFRFDEEGASASKIASKLSRSRNSVSVSNNQKSQALDIISSNLTGEAAERFEKREAEKFRFLREGCKDAQGRRPGDVNYDPRTLYLPPGFLKSLSGGQRQWWEFKSQHMDKVLFFKMGKFYELFEMDAHIGARELDLQYMKGEQPHCGFPEKNFSVNLEKLARKGYRVLVVEQTETPEQLELRRKEMGSKDKVVKREICAMVTKGTLTEGESLLVNPDASYLMSVTENYQFMENQNKKDIVIGLCMVDVSTSKFIIGQFEDDSERHWLCSILSELRPVEIIKPSKMLSPETERVLKNNTRNPLVNQLVPSVEFWDAEKTITEIRKYYSLLKHLAVLPNGGISTDGDNVEANSCALPHFLDKLVCSGTSGSYALSALGGCLFYLRQAFLDEKLLKCAEFEPLPCSGMIKTPQQPFMILDAAALENLEILENIRSGGPSGTLFAQLDHCVTAFGKRLLKGWIARPLFDTKSILERQDAIAVFKTAGLASGLQFRKELSRLPDMERLLARLFGSCEANGRSAKRVILYEDAAKKQLQEFIAALRGCKLMVQACSSLSATLADRESTLLDQLLTPGKGLPDMSSILDHFGDAFDWSEADRTGRIIPHEGCDVEYDTACYTIKEIESSLSRYLKEQQKLLGDASISYVTVGKDTYLIEVPESLRGAVPQNYELQSSKKGYFRYWTPKVKELLSELSQAETEKESKLKGILHRLILQFSEHHSKWRQLVSVTAELDILISLAIASDYYEGPTCRPIIKEPCDSGDTPSLSATSLGHPVLRSDVLGKGSFVPNDISIGGLGQASFILLTGPNMGGKSTLLRQVCMAVILAQIGADVPAESFELFPVDRIFVRMGARDHIMAGQSTFLVELTETAAMLSLATKNSLVALDELGRGTSTSDGQAIASSVLEFLVRHVQCRGLFSTHYHRLAIEYEKDDKVALRHMACQIGKGEGGVEEVTFLYRLASGSCPKSYGVNVARLAGIPFCVLEKAMEKSSDFESTYGKHKLGSEDKFLDGMRENEVAVIKDVFDVMKQWSHHVDQTINMSLLCKLQQRVSLLVVRN
ncbi:DNA mismatch repair protein MSH6 [Typha latifolia]|uniref:DNA mismatch repair protein MSH6 n=1 Tax=Typha latifolia TaxID=4733 RepID=UPI003C2D6C33